MAHSDGNGFIGFWEAMVRAELRADPTLLDDPGLIRPPRPNPPADEVRP